MDKAKLTKATISQVHEDGSSTNYDAEFHDTDDGEEIYIKQGDQWINFPPYVWDKLKENIDELIKANQ